MFLRLILAVPLVALLALAAAVAYPGSAPQQPLASIGDPFKHVDWTGLPSLSKLERARGTQLAYRSYPTPGSVAVIGVHGSSGNSQSMHSLGVALQRAGISFYALDVRGHGASAPKGTIGYRGQLDDDVEALATAVRRERPNARLGLLGFSSGGGYALHVAGDRRGKAFDFYVLLSPFIGVVEGVYRPAAGWASANVPRIIGLSMLTGAGITAFNELRAISFAIDPKQANNLTGAYSFALFREFGTSDYAKDLSNITKPAAVLIGSNDELFHAAALSKAVQSVRPDIPVEVIPNLSHIQMTTDPVGQAATVRAVARLGNLR
jgi:alpha-beta hydrolase superfamily lysophospholipase